MVHHYIYFCYLANDIVFGKTKMDLRGDRAKSILTLKVTILPPSLDSKMHLLLAHKTAPFGLFALDPKNAPNGLGSLLDHKMHLTSLVRAGPFSGCSRFSCSAGEARQIVHERIFKFLELTRLHKL